MSKLTEVELEYVYVTIPAEYICVYHRILAMLADYGEDMLKDCKATCTDRNSSVIDCFNMFNSAVAARKLGKIKLAETLIKYIKAKINQIYKGNDNSTSFVFPVDETGKLKAFVSCGERPKFYVDSDSGELIAHKYGNGVEEHFHLGTEDVTFGDNITSPVEDSDALVVEFTPRYDIIDGNVTACADISVKYEDEPLTSSEYNISYYIDDEEVSTFNVLQDVQENESHKFMITVSYGGDIVVLEKELKYEITD